VVVPRNVRPEDFVVIAPRRDPAPPVPEIPRVANARPPGPLMRFDPFKEPPAPGVPIPDPKQEAVRLMKLGRASFASGDYGRAAEHFERASTADPAEALAYFLHAQAKFAAGEYAEAAARIRAGLARDAKWPLTAFDPTELYGDRPERFFAHRFTLKKALADNPGQVTLEFLLGYQLWFSGEKAEADKLFRAAEARLPAPGPIALFKLP
jgi:tetratricopeptide (TPR) repeat protein